MEQSQEREIDEALVRSAQAGSTAAFGRLIERHSDKVLVIALARLRHRESAEELMQEVFLRAWLNIGQLREPGLFVQWAARMTRNLAINWQRDGSRASKLVTMVPSSAEVDLVADKSPDARNKAAAGESEARLLAALDKLAEGDREIVVAHFLEEVSQRELAHRSGEHHTTIGRRLTRALSQLRGILSEAPRVASSTHAKRATAALIVAVAALPPARVAALTTASRADAVIASSLPAPGLNAFSKAILTGVKTMTLGKKALALVVAAGLIFTGANSAGMFSTPVPPLTLPTISAPGGVLPYKTGQEIALDIRNGETVNVQVERDPLSDEQYRQYASNLKSAQITAPGNGTVVLRLSYWVGPDEEKVLTPTDPDQEGPLTTIQIWNDLNRVYVSSVFVRKTEGGMNLSFFSVNKPEALRELKDIESRLESKSISPDDALALSRAVFERNGLMPSDAANRMLVETTLRGLSH